MTSYSLDCKIVNNQIIKKAGLLTAIMNADDFRGVLRQRLQTSNRRALLRIMRTSESNSLEEFTGAELVAKSVELAESYCQAPSSGVVLLLLPHSAELFLLHLGLVLIGRLPAILAWPTNRIDPEKYQRNLLHQLRNLPAAQLLTLPKLCQNLNSGLPFTVSECPIRDYEKLQSLFAMDLQITEVAKEESAQSDKTVPKDALFLQFSGGTTGDQKCVVVTAPMLANQLVRLSRVLTFNSDDGVVSWLPLYHDMGLIACLWLPLWNEAPSTQFAAADWLMKPGLLFDFLSRYRATFCWLPNFAFAYLAAQKARVGQKATLGHVRGFINCSEPVREGSMDAFVQAFSALGVTREQCQASYAMAENVFAVTQTELRRPPVTFPRASVRGAADPKLLSYSLLDQHYVSSGFTLDDTLVRITDNDGNLCGDAVAGAIELRGESTFCGYWGNHGFLTHSFTSDGWYGTGDYGFTHKGALYVIGRQKDILIMGGVNVFPEDIETIVNTVPGIYPGRVVAFGIDDPVQGTETLAIVAEMRGDFDSSAAAELERQIRHLVNSALGIAPRYVQVTPERWIVKSTAGKISRRETRLRFLTQDPGNYAPATVRSER